MTTSPNLRLDAFMAGVVVPKAIDSGGEPASPLGAVLANVLLLGLFALQHTVMARDANENTTDPSPTEEATTDAADTTAPPTTSTRRSSTTTFPTHRPSPILSATS